MPFNKDRLHVALYARGGGPTMPTLEDTCVDKPSDRDRLIDLL